MHKINNRGKWLLVIWAIFLWVSLTGCRADTPKVPSATPEMTQVQVIKGESYSSKDEVAAYIKNFHMLPRNYITKAEALKLGWDNAKGDLWKVTDQKSIGGDRFSNMEGLLPKANGRQYYECDIDYSGGFRGAKRIIYSNDWLIYYTEDHYKTFKKLW